MDSFKLIVRDSDFDKERESVAMGCAKIFPNRLVDPGVLPVKVGQKGASVVMNHRSSFDFYEFRRVPYISRERRTVNILWTSFNKVASRVGRFLGNFDYCKIHGFNIILDILPIVPPHREESLLAVKQLHQAQFFVPSI